MKGQRTITRSMGERACLCAMGAVLLTVALGVVALMAHRALTLANVADVETELIPPALTPWGSVGGCGAGGSGGGGGGGAKWVGTGVSGGLIDLEVMYSSTVGQTYVNKTVSARLSGKPHYRITTGLSLPWNSKLGQVQYQTNETPTYAVTGGIGDISADISTPFGATGQYSVSLALTLPVGQSDIRRGPDAANFYLPASLQNGGGIWNLSLTLSKTKDVEDGIMMWDLGYSMPFMMRLITQENKYLDEYSDSAYVNAKDNDRFYYVFKPYGESDMGDFTPQSVNASYFYGYRGKEHYVHSWGITFAAKLGVAYIRDRDPSFYNPVRDPDHQMWSGSINYGLEFSKRKYPIFVSIVKPIHDQSDAEKPWEWNGPDWKDALYSWSVAVGVKSTMF